MKSKEGNCADSGGKLMPLVDFNSCGAKADCVAICPYDVLEMRPISLEDKAALNLKGKIKPSFLNTKRMSQINPCVMLVVYVYKLVPKKQ